MKSNYRLSYERKLRGWSQAKVAELTGTSPVNVGRWERGISKPRPYFQERLCEIFGKDARSLGLFQQYTTTVHYQQDLLLSAENALADSDGEPHEQTLPRKIYDPAIPLSLVQEYGLVGRDCLLSQIIQSFNSEDVLSLTLYGLPGVGKTSLIVAFIQDMAMQKCFADGFLWVTLGPAADLLSQLKRWGRLLGISEHEAENLQDIDTWGEVLRSAIGQRQMLLVIDDAWSMEDAHAFKVGGPRCKYLFTTRFSALAGTSASQKSLKVPKLSLEDSMALVERLIPAAIHNESELTQALVQEVGGLPFSLLLIARCLQATLESDQPHQLHRALERLLDANQQLYVNIPFC